MKSVRRTKTGAG